MVSCLQDRFNQAGFETYEELESLLLKVIHSEDYTQEKQFVVDHYSEDINISNLDAHLAIFKVLMKDSTASCFSEILNQVKLMSDEEKLMMENVLTICKLLNINPATSATGERSFSTARRVKTWLRSNMTQRRFNSLAILNEHKERTDKLCFTSIANEFISRNSFRQKKFGLMKK